MMSAFSIEETEGLPWEKLGTESMSRGHGGRTDRAIVPGGYLYRLLVFDPNDRPMLVNLIFVPQTQLPAS